MMPTNETQAKTAPINPISPASHNPKARDKASRVRDSQRASRARKRELVESLRARITEYERQGVQATLEMQQAARAVAIENTKLRDLLSLRGVSHAEIDAFLQGGDVAQARRHASSQYHLAGTPLAGLLNPNAPCQAATGRQAAADVSVPVVCEQRHPVDMAASNADSAVQPQFRSMLETPCDDATAILVQVCGHDREGSIRSSLGCMGPGTCVVSNTKLLQLMEEAG